jgi:excisionase family DNA binding protein
MVLPARGDLTTPFSGADMKAIPYAEAETYLRTEAPALLTPGDVAPLIGKHADTVRLWCKSGALPSVQPAGRGHHLIRRRDVAELVGVDLT